MESYEAAVKRSLALRLDRYGPALHRCLERLYGEQALETYARVVDILNDAVLARPDDLRELDERRMLTPDWLQQPSQIGYVAYADRFALTLAGVGDHIEYLQGLGVSLLHLMPLLEPRPEPNDGGYAVADYRAVRRDLGTMDDLEELAAGLRTHGISLELDLVLNHVAREHEWAERAMAGEEAYRDYFYVYPDRTMPDAWEESLPEVFPDFAPGNFTYEPRLDGWVWTTFNSYQWDVNWQNPAVFCEYLEIMTYLANKGVEVFRLDAIAFIAKRLGTNSQNQPEVHVITEALRAAMRIAAPAVAFKAEAIVGPTDLIGYLGTGEHHGKVSDLAYHNSFMVQLWSALASRSARLAEVALSAFPPKPVTTTWATYIRCHDDIGWAITDEDAAAAGLDGPAHRAFLSDFYSGEYPGSFARGMVFQHNPETGDRRISGALASLTGLESALETGDPGWIEDATRRIRLLHAAICGFGGVPLLYMGDEIALTNDYFYSEEPDHADDNRWVHRPRMPWDAVEAALTDSTAPQGRVLADLAHLISVRAELPHLHASVESRPLTGLDDRLLALTRQHPLGPMVQLYNVSEEAVEIETSLLREFLGETPYEAISGYEWSLAPATIAVEPYGVLWFVA